MKPQDAKLIDNEPKLKFYGGPLMVLFPFMVFVIGVIYIALSGAPDEKGFWPVLVLSLTLSLVLSKNKTAFSEEVIKGMSEPIVMIMIMAWILAATIGVLMATTGLIEALSWAAAQFTLGPVGFVVITFIICCIVSLSTGSSFATILICGPILYPTGGLIGVHLATLAGAILGGATFGDFFAPISDTTIASTMSQNAPIGPTVKSRLKYILPAALVAVLLYGLSAFLQMSDQHLSTHEMKGNPSGLIMIIVPVFIIYLFLKGKHMLHGLLIGLAFGTLWGLIFGQLSLSQIISLDPENFVAKSFIIEGISKALGICVFTILLMGMIATLKASGLLQQLVSFANTRNQTAKHTESWIAGITALAVLLTTHSVVAILTVSEFVNNTGEKKEILPIRRSNIMSLVVCIIPFILPYCIPVILMASTSGSAQELCVDSVSALDVGLYNFLAWCLMIITILVVVFSYGRKTDNEIFLQSKLK